MELHRTVGPAATKVTEVAERAGVSRMTVYNHFPTEADLVEACSSHWANLNPPPDPAGWTGESDPARRAHRALAILYPWYAERREMLENVLRDAAVVEPLEQVVEARWGRYVEAVVASLAEAWPDGDTQERRAVLHLAVDFHTWSAFASRGLANDTAARVAAEMVAGVADQEASGPLWLG